MDMDINTLRDWLNVSSTNNSRKSLVLFGVFSIPYAKRVEALNNDHSWVDQVETNLSQDFSLSYTISKKKENITVNKAITPTNMPESYGEHVEHVDINTCHPQELEILSISYSTNQPVDSNL